MSNPLASFAAQKKLLEQILKHYFDGTLPQVVSVNREQIEEWSDNGHE